MEGNNNPITQKETTEIKQAFLSSAISDISSDIQLSDTKVSIIMAALVALIAVAASCYEPIFIALSKVKPCSWLGVIIILFSLLLIISIISAFLFGILTIRGHYSIIDYKSKWFLRKSTTEYTLDAYIRDVKLMSDEDIIENMAAELYKLNDINRQKLQTNKWAIRFFSVAILAAAIISIILVISSL